MMFGALALFAQFASVLALVFNSKLLRDDRWQLAMVNSWFISATQFAFVWVVSNATNPTLIFFMAAAGGSLGCGVGHLLYTRYILEKPYAKV